MKKFISLLLAANLFFVQTASADFEDFVDQYRIRLFEIYDRLGGSDPRTKRTVALGIPGALCGGVAGVAVGLFTPVGLRDEHKTVVPDAERRMNYWRREVSKNRILAHRSLSLMERNGLRRTIREHIRNYKHARFQRARALWRAEYWKNPGRIAVCMFASTVFFSLVFSTALVAFFPDSIYDGP